MKENNLNQINHQEKQSNLFIEIKNLSKKFGTLKVFEDFNLNIYEGDRIALLGVNGSGKSTLIDIILGLQTKNNGEINYSYGFKDFLRSTQVAFQVGQYPNTIKVKHLFHFYLRFYSQINSKDILDKIIDILNIKPLWNEKANNLSYGQKKRIQSLLMFMTDSHFYIMDELTAGMDINTRVKVIALFQKLFAKKINKSMIWITHDSSEIEKLCNRVVIISKNSLQVTFDGSLDDVKTKYKTIEAMIESHLREEVTDKKANDADQDSKPEVDIDF